MSNFDWKFNTCGDPALEELRATVIDYAASMGRGKWLTILWQPGCGKTHLARRLASYWNQYYVKFDGGKQVKYSKVRLWSALYAQTWTDRGILRSMGNVGLLVIDDIGAEHGGDYDASLLFRLLEIRQNAPTVFTSNKTYRQLETDEPRIFSRLRRRGTIYASLAQDFALRPEAREIAADSEQAERSEPEDWDEAAIEDPTLKYIADRIARRFKVQDADSCDENVPRSDWEGKSPCR